MIKKLIISIFALATFSGVFAHDFAIDNKGKTIYYVKTSDATVGVSYKGNYYQHYKNEYSGNVEIPSTVIVGETEYAVTSIIDEAFAACYSLTQITLPSSIKEIGRNAFYDAELTRVDISDLGAWLKIDFKTNSNPLRQAHVLYVNGEKLEHLVIPEHITEIGNEVFAECTSLLSVEMHNGVTSIGNTAFYKCNGLTHIDLPSSLTNIGIEAFANCNQLDEIVLPETVTTIGAGAFLNCTLPSEIEIPANVTSIGQNAFAGCSGITTVKFNATACTEMGTASGAAFEACPNLETVEFAENVTLIPAYAFFCCHSLKNLALPSSLQTIGQRAFYYCENITSIAIPEGVETIEASTFQCCKNLTSLSLPNSLKTIGDYAFNQCSSLSNIALPKSLTTIGRSSFSECKNVKSVIIPNSVKTIGQEAFYNCTGLHSLTIGTSVQKINNSAFYGCSDLCKIALLPNTVPEGLYSSLSNVENRITYVANDKYKDPQLGTIKKYAFLSSWFEVDGVRYVPVSPSEHTCASIDCTYSPDVKEITIGKTTTYRGVELDVTELNRFTLYGNTHIEKLEVTAECPIDDYFASKCSNLKNLALGNTGSIGKYAFMESMNLSTLSVSNKVTDIDSYAFQNSMKMMSDGVIELDNTGNIGYSAFINCKGLKSLSISSSVKNIESQAFQGCMLETDEGQMRISNNGYVGDLAFQNCMGLKNLTITNIGAIKTRAFQNCTKLNTLEIANTGAIETEAFSNCEELEKVTVANTVTNIGVAAFEGSIYNCTDGEVVLDNKGSINSAAFRNCIGLKTARLAETITDIGASCFYNCTSLESINIPENCQDIPDQAFYNCTSLKTIDLPANILFIRWYSFYNSGLESITIPSATIEITDGAFYGCKSLAMFEALDGTEDLRIGYSGKTGQNMFALSPLKKVVIGRNLTYDTNSNHGYSPFYRNETIEEVVVTDVPEAVHTYEFYGCSGLTKATIGDNVKTIGAFSFSGCTSLATFTFGEGVQSIGNEAFSDCTSMVELTAESITPPVCGNQALDDIDKWNCTLYVPQAALSAYRSAQQWMEFFFVEGVSMLGDLNGNGKVDSADLGTMINMITGMLTPVNAADLNNDGIVNSSDLGVLINIIIGL